MLFTLPANTPPPPRPLRNCNWAAASLQPPQNRCFLDLEAGERTSM